jgi:uncharacterized membrane protein YbhN (UPF0104 family)
MGGASKLPSSLRRPQRSSRRFALSPRARVLAQVTLALVGLGVALLAAREAARHGWPLAHAHVGLTVVAGLLFVLTYGFKALGWRRLFAAAERPRSLALAAATGAACVTGLALPGRFDDLVRVGMMRRLPGKRIGVGTLLVSLFLLGLVDAAALIPMASTAALAPASGTALRIGLAVVATAGVVAGVLLLALPRLVGSGRVHRFRAGRWLAARVPGSRRDTGIAWAWTSGAWLTRGIAVFVLLDALGLGLSFPLAAGFLAAGAASGALPVGPAGAATQAGAGAGALAAAGVHPGRAIAFAVAAQLLTVAAGAAVLVVTTLVLTGGSLRERRSRIIAPRAV